MKRFFLLLAATAITAGAYAEGYQVNNLSSRQNGMAHTGTAMKLGSESLWFNPAAASFQTSKFDFSAGITGIAAKATYTTLPDYKGTPLSKFESDNKISTPIYAYANFKATDWMSVGLVFNTPFGSSMDWGDNWAGAHLIQSINLEAYNFQPTVSFKICKHLSVGAGLMLTWGSFDLSRSMFPVGAATNETLNAIYQQATGTPATPFTAAGDRALMSIKLDGKAKMAVGVNLGVMWDINDQWSLGMTYRSKMKMKVDDGNVETRMINDQAVAAAFTALNNAAHFIPDFSQASVQTELPLPASLTWGVSFRPVPKWELAIDLQYVLWSAYKELDVNFTGENPNYPMPPAPKNYSNTIAFRFGGQYHAFDWMTARMGVYVDESPVSSDYLNPETPSMTKIAYTAGLTLRPKKFMAIDLAYGFVKSADPERTGSYPYVNPLTKAVAMSQGASDEAATKIATTSFAGNYTARAHTFSIGVRFNF